MGYREDDQYFWDKIATSNAVDYESKPHKDEFKVIVYDSFPDLVHYIDKIYWLNATVMYMNAYLDVPQTKIADLLGISQFGVSKRYRASKKKLKLVMSKPFFTRERLYKVLMVLLPNDIAEVMMVYYHFNLVSIAKTMMWNTNPMLSYNNNLQNGYHLLGEYVKIQDREKLADEIFSTTGNRIDPDIAYGYVTRIHTFFESIKDECLYGSYLFKKYDNKRFSFDKNSLLD